MEKYRKVDAERVLIKAWCCCEVSDHPSTYSTVKSFLNIFVLIISRAGFSLSSQQIVKKTTWTGHTRHSLLPWHKGAVQNLQSTQVWKTCQLHTETLRWNETPVKLWPCPSALQYLNVQKAPPSPYTHSWWNTREFIFLPKLRTSVCISQKKSLKHSVNLKDQRQSINMLYCAIWDSDESLHPSTYSTVWSCLIESWWRSIYVTNCLRGTTHPLC